MLGLISWILFYAGRCVASVLTFCAIRKWDAPFNFLLPVYDKLMNLSLACQDISGSNFGPWVV